MAVDTQEKESGIVFFGEVDKHPKGGYSADYPAWYFPRQVEQLKDELRGKEEALSYPDIARSRPELREETERLKRRIQDIESSKPKLTVGQKDRLAGLVKELGDEISSAMPTYAAMRRGTADAHEEVRRMTESCVKVPPELALAAGINLSKGRASRDRATVAWKIGMRLLGEQSNSETLRKEV
jgi:hypothetical protein